MNASGFKRIAALAAGLLRVPGFPPGLAASLLECAARETDHALHIGLLHELARRYAEVSARQKEQARLLEAELELARVIQTALLPASPLTVAGLEFGARFAPSRAIGGDFYTFLPGAHPRQTGILIADISGHGVPAALLAAVFKIVAEGILAAPPDLPLAFARLDQRLRGLFPEGHFASCLHARIDLDTMQVSLLKAGQEPAILCRPGETPRVFMLGAPPLGAFDPAYFGATEYVMETAALKRGDTLFFYTDGVIDAADAAGNRFGFERLLDFLSRRSADPPQKLLDRLHDEALRHAGGAAFTDDFTAVAVKVKEEKA